MCMDTLRTNDDVKADLAGIMGDVDWHAECVSACVDIHENDSEFMS